MRSSKVVINQVIALRQFPQPFKKFKAILCLFYAFVFSAFFIFVMPASHSPHCQLSYLK
jgi:hypothetical protein